MAPILTYDDLPEEAQKNFCRDKIAAKAKKWEFRALDNETRIVAISTFEGSAFEMTELCTWKKVDHFQTRAAIRAEAKKSTPVPPQAAQEETFESE